MRLVLRLIDDLYRADMALARHTLMAARSELPAELEEMSYRWRSGRMADLGYVDFYDALEVFRPLEPTSIRLDEGTADVIPPPAEGDEALVPRRLPAPLADALDGAPFLARAVDALADPADLERLEAAMVVLVNKVLSASRVSPGDLDAAIAGARCAAATVSLGLETVAGGDVDRAARALAQVSLTRLHRAGFTVTLRLARLARALAPRAAAADDDDRALLGALLAARPWLPDGDGGLRPIASVADVRAAAGALARLALRIAIAEQALGVDLVALAEAPADRRPALDDFVRTALARALAGGEIDPTPLDVAEIPRDFDPDARARARAALVRRLDETGVTAGREYLDALVDSWLGQLHDLLGGVEWPPDPRFVTGILLRTAQS
ncbi:MAG: hypothetical protein D6689_13715 [Deltaproteobacteria bacterium]|nr:MAG: hypothetical protein D6689_13715 [Deltaproteobacteria bacterium]